MAVFPDRIVLKNSTDSQAVIEAAIQTGGSDEITQGEIVLGIENTAVKFYTKSGNGNIVTLGGTAAGAFAIGDLTDVDLSTPATNGQVIAYNSSSGNWEPADTAAGYVDPLTTDGDVVIRSGGSTTRLGIGSEGQVLTVSGGLPVWSTSGAGLSAVQDDTAPALGGSLNVSNGDIYTTANTNIRLVPNGTGTVEIFGGAPLQFTGASGIYYAKIQGPPDSATAAYTLTLPDGTGTSGQVLSTDGSGSLSWISAPAADLSSTSIDALSDVDTSTVPPTDGQALVWDSASSNWEPGTVSGGSGGGAVDSVNGQTGVVSLGIQDMDDFSLLPSPSLTTLRYDTLAIGGSGYTVAGNGSTYLLSNNRLLANDTDSLSQDAESEVNDAVTANGSANDVPLWLSGDGTSWTACHADGFSTASNGYWQMDVSEGPAGVGTNPFDLNLAFGSGPIYIAFSDPSVSQVPLTSGDVLRYDGSQFTPIASSIDFLSDVDTSTTPPSDGQALVWDNAASQWEPQTLTSGASRTTRSVTTASIANDASDNVTVTGVGRAGQLLAIETDQAAWVSVYCSQAARTADSGRLQTEDPDPGSGVLAEVINVGAAEVLVTPAVNYFNFETVPASDLYLKVVNKSGSTTTIEVTITVVPTES